MPSPKRLLLAFLSMGITLAGTVYFFDIPLSWKITVLAGAVGGNGLLTLFDEDSSESVTISRPDPMTQKEAEELLSLWMRKRLGRIASTSYRGTILLWEQASQELYIWSTKWNGKSAGGEAQLRLRPNQGCAGRAYTLGFPVYSDLTLHDHASWGIPKDAVWSEMRSILCVPLKRRETALGVVSIDSSRLLKKSHLSRKSIYEDLVEYSNKAITPYLGR